MASNEEKIRFLKSKDGKDVVIKLSEYGSKLTSDGRVMYEINKSDEQAEQEHRTWNDEQLDCFSSQSFNR